MRGLLFGVMLASAGCDYMLRIDRLEMPRGDAASSTDDTSWTGSDGDVPNPPLCAARLFDDQFQSIEVCEAWARNWELNAVLAQTPGRLAITPTDMGNGGCETAAMPFTTGGVIANVTSTVTGISAYTSLNALGGLGPSITRNADKLRFETHDASTEFANVEFDAGSMTWWRLRPTPDRNAIVAEYAADDLVWKLIGSHATTVPDTVTYEIIAGVANSSPFSGTAVFERVIVCM